MIHYNLIKIQKLKLARAESAAEMNATFQNARLLKFLNFHVDSRLSLLRGEFKDSVENHDRYYLYSASIFFVNVAESLIVS